MAIHPNCHLIGVVGGKGGVGKSVFAANLAAAFLLELKAKVLLIDLDSQSCGDQNIITGLRPLKTISEVATSTAAITPQTLPSMITKHPSGFFYIGAVKTPEEKLVLDASVLKRPLEQISQHFNFIIVDLGSTVSSLQLSVMEDASSVLVVTTPEVLAVNQTMRLMNEIMAASIPGDLLQVVINKATPAGLPIPAIQQTLRRPVVGNIPQDDVTTAGALQKNSPFVLAQSKSPIVGSYHAVVRQLTGSGILQKLKSLSRPQASTAFAAPSAGTATNTPVAKRSDQVNDPRVLLKLSVHQELITAMDLKKGVTDTNGDPAKEASLRQKTQQAISQILDRLQPGLPRDERGKLIKEILDEALGLGPLEDLLSDDSVTEIMVNGPRQIFIEQKGRLTLSTVTFTSGQQLRNVIERIVTPLGRRIDEKTPYVDARLKDGSRVNAIIEPLALDGAAITIRKFAKKPVEPQNYVEWGSMTQSMLDFLRICVENGLNIIISGGTGSGKTTLLNVMSGFIPNGERIITVEDAAELQLKQDHIVRLETRPANMEGTGAVTIRDLVRNTLRMRPDRIIVGECRGGEALDMIQAMSTGHDGSMTTTHANSPREAITRIETLCMMAGMDLPAKAIREQIAGAVNLIIQISRLSDGSRKIISIAEVIGMQGETVSMQEIFYFKEEGFDKNRKIIGSHLSRGLIPTFIEKLERKGVKIPRTIFTSSSSATPQDPKVLAAAQEAAAAAQLKKVSGGGGKS